MPFQLRSVRQTVRIGGQTVLLQQVYPYDKHSRLGPLIVVLVELAILGA